MKKCASFISFSFLFLFSTLSFSQESGPAAAAPAPAPASSIPVISIGNQVKPMPKNEVKPEAKKEIKKEENKEVTEKSEKPVRRTPVKRPKTPRVEEAKSIVLESKQLIHSRISQVGDSVLFAATDSSPFAKGSSFIAEIVEIEKMKKDKPASIKLNFEALGTTLEISREKNSDNWGGKDILIPIGTLKSLVLNKKAILNSKTITKNSKVKTAKALLSATGELEDPILMVKLGDLKYPTKIELILEPSSGFTVEDVQQDSLKLMRLNDFSLINPVEPNFDKIKVADHNKNGIKDIKYLFSGWDLIKYLPPGTSKLYFSAVTKSGKSIEIVGTARLEYK